MFYFGVNLDILIAANKYFISGIHQMWSFNTYFVFDIYAYPKMNTIIHLEKCLAVWTIYKIG